MVRALAQEIGPVRVVDVGATEYAGGKRPPYSALAMLESCTVIAFDPEQGGEELGAHHGSRVTLPYAIGDGRVHVLHSCQAPMTSSLLEPNAEFLARFENLGELCHVVGRSQLDTVTLDSVPEAMGAEFLKVDVQGATLLVLGDAIRTLSSVLVVHTEVEFAQIYRGQPQFGDIAGFLFAQGFELHHFRDFGSFRELEVTRRFAFGESTSRHLWADAVFVPTEERLIGLDDRQLLLLAAIMNDCYGAHDMAHACLSRIDLRSGSRLAEAYRLAALRREVKE